MILLLSYVILPKIKGSQTLQYSQLAMTNRFYEIQRKSTKHASTIIGKFVKMRQIHSSETC